MMTLNHDSLNYTIKKIKILLNYADSKQSNLLRHFLSILENSKEVPDGIAFEIKNIQNTILSRQPILKRESLEFELSMLDSDIQTSQNFILEERIQKIEERLERILSRPRIYERQAEAKLAEIDEKFNNIIQLNGKNLKISDQIAEVSNLEKKLQDLEADAQEMLSGVSTVQLGKQYFEAKKRYCFNKPEPKKSESKYLVVRLAANFRYMLLNIFKRIFQTDFLLYTAFIISLISLFAIYLYLIIKGMSSYKNLFLSVPLLWLSWFFQRKINTREKLYEIYNHKQKVMETYVAFKNSTYTFNSEDKMEEVLLETIKKDPSDTMRKDNTTMIENVLDKMRGMFVAHRIKKITQE